jgi:glycosyltransferase involved in cell wall biosynthesis
VHHGLPAGLHQPGKGDGNYLAFLGRISPEKGLPRAIEIAKAAGMELKIAAKVDKADVEYYEKEIKPLLDHPLVEFIGEINEQQKSDFLGGAKAFLFTIDWCEPFGMVMIESMACGTPVIAHGMGSVPEIIQHGENGFIINSVEEAVSIIRELDSFDRRKVRKVFDERFTAERMAKDYVRIYENFIRKKFLQKSLKMSDHKTIPINKDIISSKVVG